MRNWKKKISQKDNPMKIFEDIETKWGKMFLKWQTFFSIILPIYFLPFFPLPADPEAD